MDFRPLPERPEAQVVSVEDLLERARAGRIRVPELQTGLRWKRDNVVELFDSIVRGYPIGSILVNQAHADAETVWFGSTELPVPERSDAWWLVDGQQRVTTLVAALLHPEPVIGGLFAVWVNLRTTEFQVATTRPPTSDWLPLSTLGDRTRLHQWSRAAHFGPDTDAMVERAFDLEKLITQYKLTAFVVRDAPAETVRAIFGRTNNSGMPLTEDQVVDALFGDEDRGKPLKRLSTDLDAGTRFGRLDEAWLLRCVKAVAGYSHKFRFDERHQLDSELVDRTRRALTHTIVLLQQDAHLPHACVLPYRLPLIVLARFFDVHPTPHDRSRELLVRWLWRGAASQVHAKSSDADVTANTAAIVDDEDESVQALLQRVPKTVAPPAATLRWNAQGALSRLHACAALVVPPLCPDTLEPVDVLFELGAIGGSRTLSSLFVDPTLGHPEVAARVFWPYDTPLDGAPPEALASVGVDEIASDLLAQGDADAFVARRAGWVQRTMEDAYERQGAPNADDRPPIATILRRVAAG